MNKYTVVGYYEDTGLRYLGHLEAPDWVQACELCSALDDTLVIVEVFEGHLAGLTEGKYVDYADDYRCVTDEERSDGP